MGGSTDFGSLSDYFQTIKGTIETSRREGVSPIYELGSIVESEKGLLACCSMMADGLPQVSDYFRKLNEQIIDFVFSTREESYKEISGAEITSEVRFFACLLKYMVLNQKFENSDFSQDLKKEMDRLGRFFREVVAPEYKDDTKSKEEFLHELQPMGTESRTSGMNSGLLSNIIFMAVRYDSFNSDFIDVLFDATPEFISSPNVHFQCTDMINSLVPIEPNFQYRRFDLAEKYIERYPEKICSFCSSTDDMGKLYHNTLKKMGMSDSYFSDFTEINTDGKISYRDTRCEPNFLSNVIHIMQNNSESKENREEATKLFFRCLNTLNSYIETNAEDENIMKTVEYHLNCGININGELASPLDIINEKLGQVPNNSKEAEILKKSVELLTSEKIKLKTIGELEFDRLRIEPDKLRLKSLELKFRLSDLETELAKNRTDLEKTTSFFSKLGNIFNRIIKVIAGIFGIKNSNDVSDSGDKERKIRDRISEIEEQKIKNVEEYNKIKEAMVVASGRFAVIKRVVVRKRRLAEGVEVDSSQHVKKEFYRKANIAVEKAYPK
ncbi:MAG: hypothetical protein LBI29_00170 [Rickettsiales bacterium]|jgi:hypothetical protein|nr:hypothetical protein [Rickettsiales bacterium]